MRLRLNSWSLITSLSLVVLTSAGCAQAWRSGSPESSSSAPVVVASVSSSSPLPSSQTPARDCLPMFTAANVPALGEAERPADFVTRSDVARQIPAGLPGKGLAQHPMLYIGEGDNTMYLINEGKVIWTYATGKGWEFDDIWLLSNGNILFSRMSYAEEVTPAKQVVWHLDAPKGTKIHSVQPLGLDRVMVVRNGLPPKLMIINKKTGTCEVDHEIPAPGTKGPGGVHGQFRRGRMTANGTYLIAWLALGEVVEYDRDFKPIWSYRTPQPWAAVRLKNGNTLISEEKNGYTREVNPKGETVWEFKYVDLPATIPFSGSQSCVRLANGNTVICSMGNLGKGNPDKGCQLIEVTPDKQVVWAMKDWNTLGPATAVQLLDDPGIPEQPGDLQR